LNRAADQNFRKKKFRGLILPEAVAGLVPLAAESTGLGRLEALMVAEALLVEGWKIETAMVQMALAG
jgi:hypothetical protein